MQSILGPIRDRTKFMHLMLVLVKNLSSSGISMGMQLKESGLERILPSSVQHPMGLLLTGMMCRLI